MRYKMRRELVFKFTDQYPEFSTFTTDTRCVSGGGIQVDSDMIRKGRKVRGRILDQQGRMQLSHWAVWGKAFVSWVKLNSKCIVCSEDSPTCLILHHFDPTTKVRGISVMISYLTPPQYRGRWSERTHYTFDDLRKEVAKCVPLCLNCHRKVHSKLLDLSDMVV